jgi:hypothetical protein
MKTFKCITTCTWNGRYWKEGTITPPFSDDIVPPQHFEIEEEGIGDPEEPDETIGLKPIGEFTEEELRTKKFTALRKIAQQYGVYKDTMKTNDKLLKAILGAN